MFRRIFIHLSLHASIGWPRQLDRKKKKIGLNLCLVTTNQFPASSLPPFSCLVTPAVWVSGPPLLSSRDAGLCRLSLLIRLLLQVELGGRLFVRAHVCFLGMSVSVCICLWFCTACSGKVGVCEWEYGCACVLTLCLYVGVWPICSVYLR